jgi:APA family basic amino acid/polyamine antiporter
MMELVDVVEVGFLSATRIFGQSGGELMSMVISLLLVSTVSAMVFVGPRISMTIGEDMPMFAILGRKGANGIPVNAIIFQMVVTLLFIYTSTFEQVLIYASFMLTLFTSLTVFGVFVLRWKNPGLARPYKTWGYPYTPLIYVILSTWIMIYVFLDKTTETLIGLGIGAVGLVLYLINKLWFSRNHKIIKNEH